jgi:hypothetical protein
MGEFQLAGMSSLPCCERRLRGKNGHIGPHLAGERGSQFTLRRRWMRQRRSQEREECDAPDHASILLYNG